MYVAFYDQWGMQFIEIRGVVASQAVFGPNGSQDPANGFRPGGTISELFDSSEKVYSPNGSNGYVHQNSRLDVGNLCGTTVMVCAYDEQKDAWCNMLDVAADRTGMRYP